MRLHRSLPLPAALAALTAPAAGQVLLGTSNTGSDENFHVDMADGTATGPLFTGTEVVGLAGDDANQVLYVSALYELWAWPYNDPNPAMMLFAPSDGSANIRSEALAFSNGTLYVVDEFGTNVTEGIYDLDVVSGIGTPAYLYPDTSIDIGGLGVDAATGLLYGSNDSSSYPGGRGVVSIDVVAQTEAYVAVYPTGRTDIDGVAVDPAGRVILVEDEAADLHALDLATLTYDPMPHPSPVATTNTFSGGAWAPGLMGGGSIGSSYCQSASNSTGAMATLLVLGSDVVAQNDVTLRCTSMPDDSYGVFLSSQQAAVVVNPGGSQGTLCLGGSVGFHTSLVGNSGSSGSIEGTIDLTAMPNPGGAPAAVQAGETWRFQTWYRDANPTVTSNFSDGVEVLFQ